MNTTRKVFQRYSSSSSLHENYFSILFQWHFFKMAIKWTIYTKSKSNFDQSRKKRSIPFYWYPFYVNWADIHWDMNVQSSASIFQFFFPSIDWKMNNTVNPKVVLIDSERRDQYLSIGTLFNVNWADIHWDMDSQSCNTSNHTRNHETVHSN